MRKILGLLFLILISAVLLASCDSRTLYVVTFDTGSGGSKVQEQKVSGNSPASKPDNDPTRNGYLFVRWSDSPDGTEEYDFDNTKITGNTTLYAVWIKAYNIGDPGPAGGYVFYKNPKWKTDGWAYLEAAPEDVSGTKIQWGTEGGYGTDTVTGSGKKNTAKLMEFAGKDSQNSFPAAKACQEYECTNRITGEVFTDWFLPSIYELELMHDNIKYLTESGSWHEAEGDFYWSSSEWGDGDGVKASAHSFKGVRSSGNLEMPRNAEGYVRPVRFVW